MTLSEIILIAVSLAMDAFAVSLSSGGLKAVQNPRAFFRLSFHFGLFQFSMPIIGWYAGRSVVDLIKDFDHWIAFTLLAFIGLKMIHSAVKGEDEELKSNPSKGANLVMLSVATSIDALAVGLTLAMVGVEILYPSVIIGVITAFMSLTALFLGKWLGSKLGWIMEIAGGIILLVIGIKILIEHLS